MSPLEVGILGTFIMFVIIAMKVPLAIAMMLVGVLGYAFIAGWEPALYHLGVVPISTVASYTLSVVPLFMLMGEIASVSKLTEGAYSAMYKWLGNVPGGLAMATIGGCGAFGAVCGSGVAAVSTFCMVAYPEMRRYKYDPKLSLGSIAAGATLAVLIPPSNPIIIYSIFAEESVGRLFMAAFIPGAILIGLMMLTAYIWVKIASSLKLDSPPKFSWREKLTGVRDICPVILLAIFIFGGIWKGFFSPSEAGGIGALSSIIIGLARRQLNLRKIISSLKNTVTISATILFILIGAMTFNYFIAVCGIPDAVSNLMERLNWSPTIILVAILFLYLILGALMDELAMTVLTLPIFIPVLRSLGIDLVWFGILFIIICQAGMIAPPVGINVFIINGMVKEVPMVTVYKGILPFLLAIIICEGMMVAFPQIVMFLPNTMTG